MKDIQTTPLTGDKLKQMIQQVIRDAFDDAWNDETLIQEPVAHELPPVLEIKKKPDTYGTVFKLLKRLNDEQRERVFRSFGRYSMEYVLQHINRVKKATDPKSDI